MGYSVAVLPCSAVSSVDYSQESELHKLIRYGCLFELELRQMAEMEAMRLENRAMRATLRERRKSARRRLSRSLRLQSAA